MILILTLSMLVARTLSLPVKFAAEKISSKSRPYQKQRRQNRVHRLGGRELNLNSVSGSGGNSPKVYVKLEESIDKLKTGYPLYLRQSTYSLFDGNRWKHKEINSLKRFTDKADGIEDELTMVSEFPKGKKAYSQLIFIVEQTSKQAFSFPGVFAFRMPEVLVAEDEIYLIPLKSGRAVAYEALSSYYTFSEIEGEAPETIKFRSEYQHLPKVPLTDRIQRLASDLKKDSKSSIDTIRKIKQYLNDNYLYDIKAVPVSRKDTLERFMFENRKGHCTLFATAFTLLLRAAGIPARVGVGYCGGSYVPEHDLYCFREKDGHAWSEVYFKNYGWVVIDATPEADSIQKIISSSTFTDDIDRLLILGEISKKNRYNLKNISLNITGKEEYAVQILIFLLLLSFISVAVIFIKSIWFNSGNKSITRIKEIKASVQPGYFEFMCKVFAKKGYPRRKSQTAEEYLKFLKEKNIVSDELDEIIHYYYKTRYTLDVKDKNKEKEFKSILKMY